MQRLTDSLIILFLLYAYSDHCSSQYTLKEDKIFFGGKLRYITILSLLSVIKIFILFLIGELIYKKRIDAYIQFLMPVVLTYQILVFSFFWYLYFFAADYLYEMNGSAETVFRELPRHLFPLIFLIMRIKFKINFTLSNYFLTLLFGYGYYIWVYISYLHNNKWPYPLMKILFDNNTIYMFIFAAATVGYSIALFLNKLLF